MPFSSLSFENQRALIARLSRKGLTRSAIQKTEDLIVKANAPVVLSREGRTSFKPVVRKPASLEEARAWLGQRKVAAGQLEIAKQRAKEAKQIEALLKKTGLDKARPTRSRSPLSVLSADPVSRQAFTAAAHAAVAGVIDISRYFWLYKEITNMVVNVPVLNWSFVNVTIKAGGTLTFSAPGPHTFIAHSLIVEAGGRIVANNCHVDFDCEYMEFR